MSSEQKMFDESSDADGEPAAQPDVGTDRSAPKTDESGDRPPREPRKPPLEIKEIEQLEDDAPGG
jgi:hypothetical protein